MDCSSPGSSVHEIFQARILEWVAISFSRGSFQPRDGTWVSCTAGRFFTDWATREAPCTVISISLLHLLSITTSLSFFKKRVTFTHVCPPCNTSLFSTILLFLSFHFNIDDFEILFYNSYFAYVLTPCVFLLSFPLWERGQKLKLTVLAQIIWFSFVLLSLLLLPLLAYFFIFFLLLGAYFSFSHLERTTERFIWIPNPLS